MATKTKELERRLPEDFPYTHLWKPISLLLIGVISLVGVYRFESTWNASWAWTFPAVLLLLIITVMIWPSAGTRRYLAYKTPLFIFTIVFELWILLAIVALHEPSTVESANSWFQLVLLGFFLGTIIISLPGLQGEYRPGLFFRPDLLYGNGAYLARGEIFVALGLKLLTTPDVANPIGNWWGLQWALVAMVFMVPFRGILKMRMRRARFLELDTWMGKGFRPGLWASQVFLFVSLFVLVYGFANVFMGKVPFTWVPGDPMGKGSSPEWWGLAFLAAAFLVLVPLRGWYKTTLHEPPTVGQGFISQFMVWLAFLPLIYGFFLLFMGKWQHFYGPDSPSFWWGVWISALGFLMVGPLRAYAMREEFKGTLEIMIPRMADLSEEQRRIMMGRRLEVVASLPERPRKENIKLMMRIIHKMPDEPRQKMVKTRTELVADAPEERRATLMRTMALAFAEIEQPERAAIMAEVMGSVSELPPEKRRMMMERMVAMLG